MLDASQSASGPNSDNVESYEMALDLLQTWANWMPPDKGDLILTEDKPAIACLEAKPGVVRYNSWTECQDGYDPWERCTRLHVRLMPLPYKGHLATARVIFLLLNPGVSATDYYAEMAVPGFRELALKNLHQKLGAAAYPFFSLDPSLAWTGGAAYWERKLGGAITEIAKVKGITRLQASQFVSHRIAALELLPYHSKSYAMPTAARRQMHSMRLATEYAKWLAGEASAGRSNVTLILMRKHDEWGLRPDGKHVLEIPKLHARGGHLSMAARSAGEVGIGREVCRILLEQ